MPVSISPTTLSLKSVSRHHEFVLSCLARVVIMILRSIPPAAVFVELLLRYSRIFSSNSTVALADDGDDDHHLIPILCLPFSFLIICFFSLRSYSQIHSLCVTKQFFMSLLVSLSSSSSSFGCCWLLHLLMNGFHPIVSSVFFSLDVASSSPSSSFRYASFIVVSYILESEGSFTLCN